MSFTQHIGSMSSKGFGQLSGVTAFEFALNSTTLDYNLRTQAISAGWNTAGVIRFTIASGVIIGSSSTGTAGLIITGSFPSGIEIINNGYILGHGGDANGGYQSGGIALHVYSYSGGSIRLTNYGIIGGGGGAGSGGSSAGGGAGWLVGSGGQGDATTTTGGNGYGSGCEPHSFGGGAGSDGGNGGYGGGGGLGAYGGQAASCYGDSDPYDPGGIRFGGYNGSYPAPGAAIQGASYVTIVTAGTIYGAQNA